MPTVEDEDRRQGHRELIAIKNERTEHTNRIKGLLANLGLDIVVDAQLCKRLDALRQWDGKPVPSRTCARILREFERWDLCDRQVRELDHRPAPRSLRRNGRHRQVRSLLALKAIGPIGATLFVREVFGWRQIKNRRELASLAGLTPTPYQSGDTHREQGISKAGNKRIRWMMVEIAWLWLQYQPQSALSCWYQQRFGPGNSRSRKIGIVALARKLLIALWKYFDQGEVPEGAEFKPWERKLSGGSPTRTAGV